MDNLKTLYITLKFIINLITCFRLLYYVHVEESGRK